MFNIQQYESPKGFASIYKGIPIAYLEEAKQVLKENGIKYRIKYRGPRAGLDTRDRFAKQATCLKKFAKTFSIYPPAIDWSQYLKSKQI